MEKFNSQQIPDQNPPAIESSREVFWTEGFESPRRIIAKSGNVVLGTEKGLRDLNEDALVFDKDHDAFAVVDGLGGHGHGDIAARIVAEALRDDFKKPDPDPIALHTQARAEIQKENIGDAGAVYLAGRIERNGKELSIYQAGDAGLIIIDGRGKIKFSSTPTALGRVPRGNSAGWAEVDRKISLMNYDYIVAATDGLWAHVTVEEVVEIVAHEKKLEDALARLAALAKKLMVDGFGEGKLYSPGNPDNLTILIYQIIPVPLRGR